jgi:hypothetical protein
MKKNNLTRKKRKREKIEVDTNSNNIKSKKKEKEDYNNSNISNKSTDIIRNKYIICHENKLTFKSRIECNKDCVICLRSIVFNDRLFLRCGHVFHENCIDRWITTKRICPVCKVRLDYLNHDDYEDSNYSDNHAFDENITQVDYNSVYLESNLSEISNSENLENNLSENSNSQNQDQNLLSENLPLMNNSQTGKFSILNQELSRIINMGYDGVKSMIKVTLSTFIGKLFIFHRIFI